MRSFLFGECICNDSQSSKHLIFCLLLLSSFCYFFWVKWSKKNSNHFLISFHLVCEVEVSHGYQLHNVFNDNNTHTWSYFASLIQPPESIKGKNKSPGFFRMNFRLAKNRWERWGSVGMCNFYLLKCSQWTVWCENPWILNFDVGTDLPHSVTNSISKHFWFSWLVNNLWPQSISSLIAFVVSWDILIINGSNVKGTRSLISQF